MRSEGYSTWSVWAYGKAENGSGMETGNGKWKWKLKTEMEIRQSLAGGIAHAQGR